MKKKKLLFRIIQIAIILFGVSFITFCLMYVAPGDPVRAMYASTGNIPNDAVIESTREALGLNRPFIVQYFSWLGGVLHFDFGRSYSMNGKVTEILLSRIWPTLKLAISSLVLMIVISIPLGILSAVYKNKIIDYVIRVFTFAGLSIPSFWLALILMYVFALNLHLFPVVSRDTSFMSLILPTITLAYAMICKYTRQVRAAVLDEINKDYVIGLEMRGMKRTTILWKHILPNSFLPLITLIGLSFGSLLGGATVVEVIFSYPGLGNLAVKAIAARDYNIIQGYVLWMALIYMLVNLIVDISYGKLDPRVKEGGGSE